MDILNLVGRQKELFFEDLAQHEEELTSNVSHSTFLIIGGAGSIGQAVTKEILLQKAEELCKNGYGEYLKTLIT